MLFTDVDGVEKSSNLKGETYQELSLVLIGADQRTLIILISNAHITKLRSYVK